MYYGPDSHLYETNLALLASFADDELTDAELVAQIAPGTTALAELGAWMRGALGRGFHVLAAWFAPAVDPDEPTAPYWFYPPMI